jgi:hypothetical protein
MRAPETHWLRSSDEQARLAREYQSLSQPRNCLQDSVQFDEGLGVSGERARNGAEGTAATRLNKGRAATAPINVRRFIIVSC